MLRKATEVPECFKSGSIDLDVGIERRIRGNLSFAKAVRKDRCSAMKNAIFIRLKGHGSIISLKYAF